MQVLAIPVGGKEAKAHFKKTVMTPVPKAEIKNFYISIKRNSALSSLLGPLEDNELLYIWGLKEGKSNRRIWSAMTPGDIVLFVPSTGVVFLTRVLYRPTEKHPALAEHLWGRDDDKLTWELIFFISEPVALNIDKKSLLADLNYKNSDPLRGTRPIHKRVIERFGSVDIFLKKLYNKIDNLEANLKFLEELEEHAVEQISLEDLKREIAELEDRGREPSHREVPRKEPARSLRVKAVVKKLVGYKCEACGFTFPQANGRNYVEVAHIFPLAEGGIDAPSNVAVLCPNCHKQLDLGSKEVKLGVLQKILRNSPRIEILPELEKRIRARMQDINRR